MEFLNLLATSASLNHVAKIAGDSCYGLLTINFFWGLYNVIMGFRRVKQLNFPNYDAQTQFLDALLPMLRAGRFQDAENSVAGDVRALPQLTHVAIGNRDATADQLKQLVTEVVQRDIMADLDYRSGWIATVIKSGPLLGLFGTVLGMMAAFGRIGTGEKVTPAQIADEIAVALICTAMGLVTAIPFNFLLNSLTTRIRAFEDGLSGGLLRVLDAVKPPEHY